MTSGFGGVAARSHYTRVAIFLHWTIAALVITNIVIGLFHHSMPDASIVLHKSIGMLVLLLTVLRLAWRVGHRPPPLPPRVQPWERAMAALVHWLFYGLLILLPVSGWIFTSASLKRSPLNFFGLFDIPFFPVPQDKDIGHVWHERHETIGLLMIALVLLHITAALKHRFVNRDRTLDRMLPGAGPRVAR